MGIHNKKMFPPSFDILSPRHQQFERFLIGHLARQGMWRGGLPGAAGMSVWRLLSASLCCWYLVLCVGGVMKLYECRDLGINIKAAPLTDTFLFAIGALEIFVTHTTLYENMIFRYYNVIHLCNYKYHNNFSRRVLTSIEDKCDLIVKLSGLLLVVGPLCFCAVPVIQNISTGAFTDRSVPLESSLHVVLPFDYNYDIANWIIATLLFTFISVILCYACISVSNYLFFIVIQLKGNIEIIKHNLDEISTYANSKKMSLTEEENSRVTRKIGRIVDHHSSVLTSLELLNRFAGPIVLPLYLYDMVAISVLLIVIFQNPMSFIRYVGVIAAIGFQLTGQSLALQQIATAVDSLKDAIYAVPWYTMSESNKRNIYIMTLISTKSFNCKALGLVPVNLRTVLRILKSSLSYFAWLSAMDRQ